MPHSVLDSRGAFALCALVAMPLKALRFFAAVREIFVRREERFARLPFMPLSIRTGTSKKSLGAR